MKTTSKEAYLAINKLLLKHKDLIRYDVNSLIYKSKAHLFAIDLKEVYGLNINIDDVESTDWNRFGEYMSIGKWGTKYNRTISWSADKRQPVDEILLSISFATGAYIFGGDYPTDLFNRFFNELQSYNPDYLDVVNHYVFFKIERAKDIFNNFNDILKKYKKFYSDEANIRKAEKLKAELAQLEKELR